MAERITVNSKKPASIKENLVSHKRKTDFQSDSSPVNQILYLQRTIGNQAVQRMVRSGALQAKLRIGQPGDVYEQEADRVADAVMRMPEPGVQREAEPEEEETLQTKPLVNQIRPLVQVQRQEEPEEEEEEEMLQAKPLAEEITPLVQRQVEPEEEEEETLQSKSLANQITPLVQVQRQEEPEEEEEMLQAKPLAKEITPEIGRDIQSIKGTGHPLSTSELAFFEPRFGADFDDVRVHSDARAAHLARSVNARAFTLGRNVVFGAGQYAPGMRTGRQLLAHELAHVMQQNKEVTNNLSETNFGSNLPLLEISQSDNIIYRNIFPKLPGGVATSEMVKEVTLEINNWLQSLMLGYHRSLLNFYVKLVSPSSKQVKPQFGKIALGIIMDEVFNQVGQKIPGVQLIYNFHKEIQKEKQRISRAKTMRSAAAFFIKHNNWITSKERWLKRTRSKIMKEALRKFKNIRYSARKHGLKPLRTSQAITRNLKNQYWLSLKLYLINLKLHGSKMTVDHIFKLLSGMWIASTKIKYFRNFKMSAYIEIRLAHPWNITKAYIHAPGGKKIAEAFNQMKGGVNPLNLKARKVISFYYKSFRMHLDADNRYKGGVKGNKLLYRIIMKKGIPIPSKWDGT